MDFNEMLAIIVKVIDKFGDQCSAADKEKIKGVLLQFFQEGTSPTKALGQTEEDIELIYSYTVSLYDSGKYQEALPGFRHLFTLDPNVPRYSFGYAACLHKLKQYQEAIEYYLVAAQLDPENPAPWGHAADCAIHQGRYDMACVMLAKTVEVAGNNPAHAQLKKEAALVHDEMKKQLDKPEANAAPKPAISGGKK